MIYPMNMVDYVCHRFVVSSSCEVTCVRKKALSYTLEVKNFKDKTFCSREWNIPGEIGKWHCCWCPDDMASAAMVLTSWILSLFCPAKQGYCDVNILTSGHPCQYQFSFFRWLCFLHSWYNHFLFSRTILHALDRMPRNLKLWNM